MKYIGYSLKLDELKDLNPVAKNILEIGFGMLKIL